MSNRGKGRAREYNRALSTQRARQAYTEAMLKSNLSHEMSMLKDYMQINEGLMADESKAMGIGSSAFKILGLFLGGPLGMLLGDLGGTFLGDIISPDPSISTKDMSKFDLLSNKALDYKRSLSEYQSLKATQFGLKAASGLFSAYMQAGGFDPKAGGWQAPGEIDWWTFGNTDGNMFDAFFNPTTSVPGVLDPTAATPLSDSLGITATDIQNTPFSTLGEVEQILGITEFADADEFFNFFEEGY